MKYVKIIKEPAMDIKKIAKKAHIKPKGLICYGNNIAKVNNTIGNKKGKLVLVTAMTSNKTGIGKTTISIGLADALNMLHKNAMLALREPSMGPVFGIKGGATGGGLSRIEPSDEINLHFTGDFHAIAQANNLLASIIDNHIFQGNELGIDVDKIFFKRCIDLNDRSLRQFTYNIGENKITSNFNITAASETMAVLCLSENLQSLKTNLGNILVALNKSGKPIYAKDLHAEEAMTILLKDAIKPNLVQTREGTPTLVHMGPFANIAHGCNSVVATKFALTHADYCITEAGFGSDLGAEKFLDIKTDILHKTPDACVLVIVAKVIKEHGAGDLVAGFENVKRHISNLKDKFNLNTIVAINRHADDSIEEIETLKTLCLKQGVPAVVANGYAEGGRGCLELARLVIKQCTTPKMMNRIYNTNDDIKTKIEKIATQIYGAIKVEYSSLAEEKLVLAKKLNCNNFYVNIAKTQFSFSADKNLLGAPTNFVFTITDVEIRAGAKMIVPIAGNMLLMPALGRSSNYKNMKIDADGNIEGLF